VDMLLFMKSTDCFTSAMPASAVLIGSKIADPL